MFWGEAFAECPSKNVFRCMKTAGKTFSCPWLFNHLLFNKITIPYRENTSNRTYFIDGNYSMDNFEVCLKNPCTDFY